MQVVRCEAFEAVSFRKLTAVRGHHLENSSGVWVDPVTEIRFTRPASGDWRLLSPDESTGIFD